MSTTMVELQLKQDCYLICYDVTNSEEIRNKIVELADIKGISDASEFMLSESCYLIPKSFYFETVNKKYMM